MCGPRPRAKTLARPATRLNSVQVHSMRCNTGSTILAKAPEAVRVILVGSKADPPVAIVSMLHDAVQAVRPTNVVYPPNRIFVKLRPGVHVVNATIHIFHCLHVHVLPDAIPAEIAGARCLASIACPLAVTLTGHVPRSTTVNTQITAEVEIGVMGVRRMFPSNAASK